LAQGARAIFTTGDPNAEASAQGALQAGAVLVSGGNPLSHLASLSRSSPQLSFMSGNFGVTPDGFLIFPGERIFRSGASLTLDPRNGRIYEGEMNIAQGESPIAAEIRFLLEDPNIK